MSVFLIGFVSDQMYFVVQLKDNLVRMIIGMNGWSFSINVDWCTLTCGLYSHSELSFLKMRWLAFIFHLKWGDRLQREDRNIPSAEKLYLFAQCLVLFWVAIIPIFLNEFKYIKGTYLAVHPVERCTNATCFCNYLIVAYHLRFIYIYIYLNSFVATYTIQ